MISYQITQGDIFVLIFTGICIMGFVIALIYNELRFRKGMKELKERYAEFQFPDPPLPWERG